MENIAYAFVLTLIAGLCTGIGGFIALFKKSINKSFLSISLGFSAGVMIYVSMIDIFPKAQSFLSFETGEKQGAILTIIAFFSGMFLTALIDKLVPEEENPHEIKTMNDSHIKKKQSNANGNYDGACDWHT